ncbi:MAG TPA: HNH endonuclease signature motif containing protein, partial [Anaeromyxobacteraceae bacterium]|nr:HNH endonuclease signature motif containing protein [Anaeromyxobacteraceae bacterium]
LSDSRAIISSMDAATPLDLEPLTRAELEVYFRGGEPEADECEQVLAWAARARGALDLAIGEGLRALKRGDRLAQLGYHLDDYAREVLDIGERTTRQLVRLATELRDRPKLREALRSGKVRIRAAETVLPVAVGDAEATWVERAARCTVRELEEAVRRARSGLDADEEWLRLRTHLSDDDRVIVDGALDLAGVLEPELSRIERFEAIAQEFLGWVSSSAEPPDDNRLLGIAFRRFDPGNLDRRAALERDTDRWAILPVVGGIPAPDLGLDELSTAQEIDARLRELARRRASLDDVIGWCAHALRRSGVPSILGFATFRQYVEERLGLPPRAVEQREALERRLWASPALRDARRRKVSYEKLRVLSRLPERDIRSWTPRALALTCIELRRRVEGERERQTRAAKTLAVSMPRRIAALVAAAVQEVRDRVHRLLPLGKCLSFISGHFVMTWQHELRPARTRAQKVRERDQGLCQVPGCSRAAVHTHHVEFRSHGGSDDVENLTALCAWHHLRGVHGGYLRVAGRAPDALRWFLNGEPWAASAGAQSSSTASMQSSSSVAEQWSSYAGERCAA